MALVTAVVQVHSLTWELPHAIGMAKKKKSEDSSVASIKAKPMSPSPIPDIYSTEMHTHVFQKTQMRMLIALLFEIALKLETIQMLIDGRIEREIVVYSCSATQ